MTLPDCESCDSANSLEKIRADTSGLVWAVCKSCSKVCLVKDGRVIHKGT